MIQNDKPEDTQAEPAGSTGGEDDSSTERNGDDSHLHEDQKAPSFPSAEKNDPKRRGGSAADTETKTQDLAKAGRDIDPNKGGD
ncbi:hypothetical protein SAMN06297144_0393 [Sphingomonas guangdongensis]|uniref:Uncharacterized protein n=1 Tax=Sphingomonas guangdongensis TaxID=1141890 RepID=A0A285QGD7_9SPHN|nr:hypothetical protein [Sphingomonas guangdongensis]SOB79132.1 hypothetical protein SAMN06297144_0393 [Sphingomonas guangdongensis]